MVVKKGPERGKPGVKMDSLMLTNGSEKVGLLEDKDKVRTRIGDIVNIESDITLPLLQGLV